MNMNIRNLFLCTVLFVMSISSSHAADRYPYEAKVFEDARAAGKPILVHVTAPWCGECRKQTPIVAELATRQDFSTLTIFDVDFDSQKDALRTLHIQKQSTLVIFKGKVEVARAVGITRRGAIESLMKKAF